MPCTALTSGMTSPFEGGISQRLDHLFRDRRRALISVKRKTGNSFDSYCEVGLLVNVRRVAENFLCQGE